MSKPIQTITDDCEHVAKKLPPFLQRAYQQWFDLYGYTPVDRAVVAHKRPLMYAEVSSRDMKFCVKLDIEFPTIYTYQLKTPDEIAAQPVWEYV